MAASLNGDSSPGPSPSHASFDPATDDEARLAILAYYQPDSLIDDPEVRASHQKGAQGALL